MVQANTTQAAGGIGWRDWQAGLAVFIILFLLAETDAAPVAEVIAWGATTGYIVFAVNAGGLSFKKIADATNP